VSAPRWLRTASKHVQPRHTPARESRLRSVERRAQGCQRRQIAENERVVSGRLDQFASRGVADKAPGIRRDGASVRRCGTARLPALMCPPRAPARLRPSGSMWVRVTILRRVGPVPHFTDSLDCGPAFHRLFRIAVRSLCGTGSAGTGRRRWSQRPRDGRQTQPARQAVPDRAQAAAHVGRARTRTATGPGCAPADAGRYPQWSWPHCAAVSETPLADTPAPRALPAVVIDASTGCAAGPGRWAVTRFTDA